MSKVTGSVRKANVKKRLENYMGDLDNNVQKYETVNNDLDMPYDEKFVQFSNILVKIVNLSTLLKGQAGLTDDASLKEKALEKSEDMRTFAKGAVRGLVTSTDDQKVTKSKLESLLKHVPTPPPFPKTAKTPKTVKKGARVLDMNVEEAKENEARRNGSGAGRSMTSAEEAMNIGLASTARTSIEAFLQTEDVGGVEEQKGGETDPFEAFDNPATSRVMSAIKGVRGELLTSARTRGATVRRSNMGGMSFASENSPGPSVDMNAKPPPYEEAAAMLVAQPLVNQPAHPEAQPQAAYEVNQPGDEEEDAVGMATTESTRQNELADNETATLKYNPNFTEVLDASFMRLATDAVRGNLGAGTAADMQSADLWGNQFTQHVPDIPVEPERFLTTGPSGLTIEQSGDVDATQNIYSFLPFAKLGGTLIWIPRHVKAARLFFTADDYSELVSHIRDGDPLTLDKTEEVDTIVMTSSIIRTYGTLKQFCDLGPMLPATASVEQVYAEWLEMRQIGSAVARYEQITGGMYENSELSMKGGIRSAVASALRPFIDAWNRMHKNAQDQIAPESATSAPASAPMYGAKRKAEAGIIEPEEYNPQFSYQPQDLKRVKFSIPSI